jgi:hypothetical protein
MNNEVMGSAVNIFTLQNNFLKKYTNIDYLH